MEVVNNTSQLNLLKMILSSNTFHRHGPHVGPMIILFNDSCAKRNALELCWPGG
ncbi:305_t:CDS:2, partial [Dentiscutata erythropus]